MKKSKFKNIIFIEDDLLDFELYKSVLSDNFQDLNIIQLEQIGDDFVKVYSVDETIIFLDINLNGIDGIDLYLKKLKPYNYKTVIHTSSDNPTDITRSISHGIKYYFSKQIGIEKIREQLVSIIIFLNNNYIF